MEVIFGQYRGLNISEMKDKARKAIRKLLIRLKVKKPTLFEIYYGYGKR